MMPSIPAAPAHRSVPNLYAMMMRTIVLLWENFGPMHTDRCEALAAGLRPDTRVLGLQWTGRSAVYDWTSEPVSGFTLVTLFPDTTPQALTIWRKFTRSLAAIQRSRARDVFLSHYHDPAIVLLAWVLRLTGRRVYAMVLSKFDDYDRRVERDLLKWLALRPYRGFLTNRGRATDYLQYLTNGRARCVTGHNTLSVDEVRRLAGAPPAPGGLPHAERVFCAITRLVPKKNLFMLLEAYRLYRAEARAPRPLRICGGGPQEAALRAHIAAHGLDEAVTITGFIQRPAIARELARALALILPSTEEQFGNVVIEAQAMGVPCLISDNCGARETLLRSGENGFLSEPDNPEGLARFMLWVDEDEGLWRQLAEGCAATVGRCDTGTFVEGVRMLAGGAKNIPPTEVTQKTRGPDSGGRTKEE